MPADKTIHKQKRRLPFRIVKNGITIFIILIIAEYIVIPELSGAKKSIYLISRIDYPYLILGICFEALSIVCYAFLTRSLLAHPPKFSKILRIDLSTLAVSHVLPGGTAPGTALAKRLLSANGVSASDTYFTLATQGIGSAVVLNAVLWISLIGSLPFHSINNPLYIVALVVGVIVFALAASLILAFTRAKTFLTFVADKITAFINRVFRHHQLRHDSLKDWVLGVSERIKVFFSNSALIKRAIFWALLNWLFDAFSLFIFVLAYGKLLNPFELLVAYGLANVLAAIPITPGGLGVVEGVLIPTLIGFHTPATVATLGVLTYRFFNFWLPIPVGAFAYLSLRVDTGLPWSGYKGSREELTG